MKNKTILLFLITFFYACKEQVNEPNSENKDVITISKEQFKSSNMEIGSLSEIEFNTVVHTTGKIDVPPQYRAKISPFMGGYVKTTKLLVGDKVLKGQALITLENTEYLDLQKEYVEIAEKINYLKSEYERQKTLYNEKITSQKNYLKAESEYRQAKGMYQSLREKLVLLNINPTQVENGKFTSIITLTSPISGDITVMNANIGMFMSPSDIIMEVVDTNHLHLNLTIFEKDILKIKEGQSIDFTIPEASKEIFKSKVQVVGKSIENESRTSAVFGILSPEIKKKLLSGMFVEAEIIIGTKKGFGIPSDAIIKENNKNYVAVELDSQTNYSFKKVLVTVGEKTENETEIIPNEYINQKLKILTKGVFDIVK